MNFLIALVVTCRVDMYQGYFNKTTTAKQQVSQYRNITNYIIHSRAIWEKNNILLYVIKSEVILKSRFFTFEFAISSDEVIDTLYYTVRLASAQGRVLTSEFCIIPLSQGIVSVAPKHHQACGSQLFQRVHVLKQFNCRIKQFYSANLYLLVQNY